MRALYVISFNSFSLSSLIDLRPRFANSGLAGVSNELLFITLAALFCNFWSLFMKVVLQHPQTEEKYLKYGSIMLIYKFFKMFCDRGCFACFNTPKVSHRIRKSIHGANQIVCHNNFGIFRHILIPCHTLSQIQSYPPTPPMCYVTL